MFEDNLQTNTRQKLMFLGEKWLRDIVKTEGIEWMLKEKVDEAVKWITGQYMSEEDQQLFNSKPVEYLN